MASGKPKFYWDTAPLIAWITDEKRKDPAEMSGLAEVVEMVERGHAILMTSVLWRAEVLNGTMTATQRKRLEDAFDGRSLVELQIDSRVMALAGEIRDFQRKSAKKDALKNVRVPDAIHLASAIHYDAAEFHTFDGAKNSGHASKLLTLDGNVAGHRLKVCIPKANQLRLEFPNPEKDEEL
ncbi:type II toxin-antitoxin system VapC family toxin [Burkholderia gladioli]|uniref:type II toxin-antitoxin system VapC family toxin n=1 Tax=Burkholderia gladioli TaxID=28095 RepID=UPI001641CA43|nr:PIN domain-containing protein [Burkholderia gladioli]